MVSKGVWKFGQDEGMFTRRFGNGNFTEDVKNMFSIRPGMDNEMVSGVAGKRERERDR